LKPFRLLFRVVIGVLFLGHGSHKLVAWRGGRGLKATAEGFEQMGLRPGLPNAIAAAAAETGGGALLVAGFLTPVGAASVIGSMLIAVHRVHLKNGPWITNGGYEYNLVIILALLALVEAGPGPISLDAVKGCERSGTAWALASLAAGGLGAGAVHAAASAAAPPAPPAEPAPIAEPAHA
jgi:putative oxidoreductase